MSFATISMDLEFIENVAAYKIFKPFYLKEHPYCEMVDGCLNPATQIHHIHGIGMAGRLLTYEPWLRASCEKCYNFPAPVSASSAQPPVLPKGGEMSEDTLTSCVLESDGREFHLEVAKICVTSSGAGSEPKRCGVPSPPTHDPLEYGNHTSETEQPAEINKVVALPHFPVPVPASSRADGPEIGEVREGTRAYNPNAHLPKGERDSRAGETIPEGFNEETWEQFIKGMTKPPPCPVCGCPYPNDHTEDCPL